MNKKRIRIGIIITFACLIVIVAGVTVLSVIKRNKKLTWEGWYQKQAEYILQLQTYSETVDTIFKTYTTGSTSDTAFLSDLEILETSLFVIKTDYDDYKEKYPIKETSNIYNAYYEQGCKEVESCFEALSSLLTESSAVIGNRQEVYYIYLSYFEEINTHMAGYQAVKLLTNGMEGNVKYEDTEEEGN